MNSRTHRLVAHHGPDKGKEKTRPTGEFLWCEAAEPERGSRLPIEILYSTNSTMRRVCGSTSTVRPFTTV
jgi:hypothetical protein